MKTTRIISLALLLTGIVSSCEKFLDREPISDITPESYLTTAENLSSYTLKLYDLLPTHSTDGYGTFQSDRNTDNMVFETPDNMWAPGYWRVPESGGAYDFTDIYKCNFYFDHVLPKYYAGDFKENKALVNQSIGEAFFFRAWCYFVKLKELGDFPIVKNCLPNEMDALVAASRRAPRNEVARFILADLDSAIVHLGDNPTGGKNRLNKDCAHLFKSRVALYEGTWLKYFDGTAWVPGGPDWPGGNYIYPTGSIEEEVMWLLHIAMDEARMVADKYELVTNTGLYQNTATMSANPYYDMFADSDMEKYAEILLWRAYDVNYKILNRVNSAASTANNKHGTTKSMVDAFLMQNGLPIYAAGSGYKGDDSFAHLTDGRDSRLVIFLKTPGSNNFHNDAGTHGIKVEPWPNITASSNTEKYVTGYCIRKGKGFDGSKATYEDDDTGSIVFRATEAYLNYIEACAECTNTLDNNAKAYWKALRKRSEVNQDYTKTVNNTNMDTEAKTDLAAYSAGHLVKPLIYNIRRERRCELMAEGFRRDDLRRWRAMDQLIQTPYHVLGINLWENADLDKITAASGTMTEDVNVSNKSFSKYLAPYHINRNNPVYDGYRWKMAHYLSPIAIKHLLITANGGSAENATLYQNPGWSNTAGQGAIY